MNDSSFFSEDDDMTEAELEYLDAIKAVKELSRSLVIAERAFQLVRDRIEGLINEYEEKIVQQTLDSGSIESSSLHDFGQQIGKAESYDSLEERRLLELRARQAETQRLNAEREVIKAQNEANRIRLEQQQEVEKWKVRYFGFQTYFIMTFNLICRKRNVLKTLKNNRF